MKVLTLAVVGSGLSNAQLAPPQTIAGDWTLQMHFKGLLEGQIHSEFPRWKSRPWE